MNKIKEWLLHTKYKTYKLKVASSDASLRSYYRLYNENNSVVLMDSSLEKKSLEPFIKITKRLIDVGVNAPNILAQNLEAGFLILEDFGTTHYLDILNTQNFKDLYTIAIDTIIKMQNIDTKTLPLYNKSFLDTEMDLMSKWYLEKNLGITLSNSQKKLLKTTLNYISDEVLKQPQGLFVHRDFHSRNIMFTNKQDIGVIDYQDAMSGSITYDLVSLLKDCYISFNRQDIERLVLMFRDKLNLDIDDATFIRYFDFTGLQRHIKVLGIFSRLYLRDKKAKYLKDIPLTLEYVINTASRYKETKQLALFLNVPIK